MPSARNIDGPTLAGISGRSNDGRALAHHRAPAPDIAPWIARLFVTTADQPADQTLRCGLFNDTAFVRLIIGGQWTGSTADGPVHRSSGALLFGPHTRRMPIAVTGPFATAGFSLRPGALAALGHPWGSLAPDRITDVDDPRLRAWYRPGALDPLAPDALLDRMEEYLRALIAERLPPLPESLAEALDLAAFADPSEPLGTFAARHGVTSRTVSRMAQRCFAMTPKLVMRRARVLDMASQLLGFADREEAEEHAMRYYDQSHLIRDFRALMGMTPRELARTPQPILTLGLEPRQARRLEALGRLDGDQQPPWR
jgi:AraC-like DNA-binding protein